ncbi:hypothetical protein AcW1_008174 [Taiwanofungus camphoratus]|nr:hypothetical protein AcV5_008470 [Antrodia cinnamomea]KAI0951018.1 hypothetical protein AcW1_008174 [Antrodia cinnamomea]
MNSFWNFLDWILPSVRLSDDLEDPYALHDGYSVHISTTSSSAPSIPEQQDPRRDWNRDREREQERERVRVAEQEREKDRQRIQALEREKAALYQRIASLENDLQSARQSLATFNLISSPVPPPESMNQPQIYHPPNPDPANLRTSYDSMLSSYSVMHRALYERTEEVASLRSFLSKTDEWSGAQLIQGLRDLNAEIVQLAASVAEEFSPSLDRRIDLVRQSDRELVTNALGPMMTNLLATRDHAGDPTLVQFAIQAWEVCCVGRVLDAFCFGLPVEIDQFLTSVFEHMHRAEPQPTTSRWRALTYMHARALLPSHMQTQPSPFVTLTETNLRGLLAILALSGCTDSRGVHREPLRTRFGGALSRIGECAERIAGVIKEGVMSGVFEITWIGAKGSGASKKEKDRWFDWATMENVYAGHGSERCKVLCTVEFGLVCVRRVGWTGGSIDGVDAEEHPTSVELRAKVNGHGAPSINGGSTVNGTRSEGMLTRNLLLKPKVLLESVAEIL